MASGLELWEKQISVNIVDGSLQNCQYLRVIEVFLNVVKYPIFYALLNIFDGYKHTCHLYRNVFNILNDIRKLTISTFF